MLDKEWYLVRDKISGQYCEGSKGQGTNTFSFWKKKTGRIAPKLYTIGYAKSTMTHLNQYKYDKENNLRYDLELVKVKLVEIKE